MNEVASARQPFQPHYGWEDNQYDIYHFLDRLVSANCRLQMRNQARHGGYVSVRGK